MARPRHSKGHDWTPQREKRVRYMMGQGERLTEIAKAVGCSTATLRRYLDSPRKVEDKQSPQQPGG